jgi:ribosomal protein S18 acetylase RimI-like enzyme
LRFKTAISEVITCSFTKKASSSTLDDMNVLIRRAETRDAGAVLACLHAAFEPYRRHYSPAGFADTTLDSKTIQHRMAEMTVFVAENNGDVIGTIAGNVVALSGGDEGHIRGMAVLAEWQGLGVAELLLAAAESELRSRGCKQITLDTTAPLERAIKFYERHGYQRSGKVGDFFGMPLYEYVKRLEP